MSYIKNNKILLLIIAVLLVTNLGLLYFKVWNRGHHGTGDRGSKGFVAAMLEKDVGFNKEQLAKYEELRTKHFDAMKPFFDDVSKAKDSLYRLMNLEQTSDSLINAYAEIVSEKQKTVELKMFYYLKTVEALCTPEQRPKFDSVVQKLIKKQPGPRRNK